MTLPEKAKAVESLFEELDQSIRSFQGKSGLFCKFGCGQCCLKPDIEATVLEFIPFALAVYQSGEADRWMMKIAGSESVCVILNPGQAGAGLCSEYTYRGLICRLFGYSARLSKYGERELITCAIIKSEQSSAFDAAAGKIGRRELEVPMMSDYYMRLYAIDPDLSRERYPINLALKKSMETVMHYFAYPRSE